MGNAFDVRFHCAPFKMKPGRRQKEYPGSVILCYLKLTAPPADVEQITEVRSKEEGERVGESGREGEKKEIQLAYKKMCLQKKFDQD